MEKWSVTLTGSVRPGADADSVWRRVAGVLGMDASAFGQKVRPRLPVTFRAGDEASVRNQQQQLVQCGVDAVLLGDDGGRLWVRSEGRTCGPVSTAYARGAWGAGRWNGRTLACRQGESRWQPLSGLVAAPAFEDAEPPAGPLPSSPPSASGPAPAVAAAQPQHGPEVLPTHAQAPGLHAGFWLRVVAYLLDSLVALVVLCLPLALVAFVFDNSSLVMLGGLAGAWLYFALFESSSLQATPGKLALGLRVVDMRGARIGFGRATGRYFGKLVSGMILDIGYLLAAWTERKQALHDLMAACCVVHRDRMEALGEAESTAGTSSGMPGWAIALITGGACVFVFCAGILFVIAVGSYHRYVVRSQVSEGMALSAPTRDAVEAYLRRHGLPPNDNRAAGLVPAAMIHNPYVSAVRVHKGAIVITFGGAKADASLRGHHLVLKPLRHGHAIDWKCGSPDIDGKYLSARCRP